MKKIIVFLFFVLALSGCSASVGEDQKNVEKDLLTELEKVQEKNQEMDQGKDQEIVENIIEKEVELFSSDELNKKAMDAYYSKDYQEAINLFKRTLDIDPENEFANYNIACVYSILKNKDKALTHLNKAIEINSERAVKAKIDPDFNNIKDESVFKELVGSETLEDVFLEILTLLNDKKYKDIDKYIDKTNKLSVVYNPALYSNVKTFDSFVGVASNFPHSFEAGSLSCDLKYQAPPTACVAGLSNDDLEDKCFIGSFSSKDFLRKSVLEELVNVVGLSSEQAINDSRIKIAEKIDKITSKIISVSDYFTLYFSSIGGNWYLSIIDLSDCSI